MGILLTVLLGSGSSFAVFGFIAIIPVTLLGTGTGSLLGYLARRYERPSCLFKKQHQEPIHSKYSGLRCVACCEPVTAQDHLCPYCGWTQPGVEK